MRFEAKFFLVEDPSKIIHVNNNAAMPARKSPSPCNLLPAPSPHPRALRPPNKQQATHLQLANYLGLQPTRPRPRHSMQFKRATCKGTCGSRTGQCHRERILPRGDTNVLFCSTCNLQSRSKHGNATFISGDPTTFTTLTSGN